MNFGLPGWRATHSVGGIPFYVRGSTSTYPPSDSIGALGIGTREYVANDQGFGDGCTHSNLNPECLSDEECHPLYKCHTTGKVCVRKNIPNCGLPGYDACWCYVHSDCDATKMCSGTGKCVTPVIEVRNEMSADEAEFRIYTQNCTADNSLGVDMYAASPWGRIGDALHAHGLCGYRHWWEYNRTLSMSTSGSAPGGFFILGHRLHG